MDDWTDGWIRENGELKADSLVDVFRRRVSADPSRPAVVLTGDRNGTTSWTYAELDRAAGVVAAHLAERLSPGDRALLLYPVGLDLVAAFLGCAYAGVIAVPAPLPGRYRHHRARVRAIAADAGVAVVLTGDDQHQEVDAWATAEKVGAPVLATSSWSAPTPPAAQTSRPGQPGQVVQAGHRTLLLLQYTSGSTGLPKGVALDHGNVLHNTGAFVRAARIPPGVVSGGWIPLYHDMGLSCELLPALLLGGTCHLMDPLAFVRRPESWLQLIDRHRIELSLAPNFAYDLCVRRVAEERTAGLDLSSWTWAMNGSEPVKPGVMAAFAKRYASHGFREESFVPSYGLAEATVYASLTTGRLPVVQQLDAGELDAGRMRPAAPGARVREAVSCGRAELSGAQIVDPVSRAVLPDGEVGEIWLRSRSVARGYWQNPEATSKVFDAETTNGVKGFLRTGDLGAVQDGELYVHGRIKDVLLVRGRNIHPHDIEHELRQQHPQLGSVGAVFGVPGPDPDDEERIVVTHEIRGTAEHELAPLAAALAQTVSREFGVAAEVLLLPAGGVLRTTSGKIQRAQMREHYLTGQLRPRRPASATTS